MYFNKKMRKRLAVTTAGLVLALGVSVQAAEPREDGARQRATPVTAVQETMQTTSAEAVDFGMEQAETEQSAISMDHLTDPLHAEETVQFRARDRGRSDSGKTGTDHTGARGSRAAESDAYAGGTGAACVHHFL